MRLFSSKKVFFTKDQLQGDQFSIGDFTYGTPVILNYDPETRLTIGRYCSLAGKVTILLGGDHRIDWGTTYPFTELPEPWPEVADITGHPASRGDIVIGNDVWIGYGATIFSGVTIGDGAVIGSGALVTKDIEPYGIATGNPAQVIRKRFTDPIVTRMLKLAWWNWPEEKIRANVHLLMNSDIEALLRAHDC